MRILTCYPFNARKLYHSRPGQVVQRAMNDGSFDSNLYLVTDQRTEKERTVVNIANGEMYTFSVSTRVLHIKDAVMTIFPGKDTE